MLAPRRKPNRLKYYDYSRAGYYFITACTRNMAAYFGRIEEGRMILNKYGEMVNRQWPWLEKQYPYIRLDKFIVMPNHFHGILIIENYDMAVGTGRDLSVQKMRKIKSLSELIGAFKTTSSKQIHRNGLDKFSWQRSFYDHVIRNDESLFEIRNYIQNNPAQWEWDRNNPGKKDLITRGNNIEVWTGRDPSLQIANIIKKDPFPDESFRSFFDCFDSNR